ncbi:hypothetical protein V8E36_004201 [Tilletia maclaganii]
MREVTKKVVLLSDFEVLQLAKDYSIQHSANQDPSAPLRTGIEHLNTVHLELLKYLESSNEPRPCAHQTSEGITAFLAALQDADLSPPLSSGPRREQNLADHHLTKSERLLLVNHAPRTEVYLNALVEECFVRFTPEQRQLMLDLVQQHLSPPPSALVNGSGHDQYVEGAGSGGDLNGIEDMLDEDAYLNA